MNKSYSRNVSVFCPKCKNIMALKETVNISSIIDSINESVADLNNISVMNNYGIECSRYSCKKCGIPMNTCDVNLYPLFKELCLLPYNVESISTTGSIGGCINGVSTDIAEYDEKLTYAYPNILFCNSDQAIINNLISAIESVITGTGEFNNMRIQINPIGYASKDESGNTIDEKVTYYQIMIYINDIHFTNSLEEYNSSVETFIKFCNTILNTVKELRISEEKRVFELKVAEIAANDENQIVKDKTESTEEVN